MRAFLLFCMFGAALAASNFVIKSPRGCHKVIDGIDGPLNNKNGFSNQTSNGTQALTEKNGNVEQGPQQIPVSPEQTTVWETDDDTGFGFSPLPDEEDTQNDVKHG
ncbi:unnamed protein product [Ophioblennius macclurei]